MSILDIVEKHQERLKVSFNLVASENIMSVEACQVMASDIVNRYCMPDESNRPAGMWDYPNQKTTKRNQKSLRAGLELETEALEGALLTPTTKSPLKESLMQVINW